MSDAESDDEDGILERQNWGNGSLSLKSKMEALHDTLAIDLPTPEYSPRGPISDLMSQDNNAGGRRTFSMELPPPPKLLALLQVFFQEHNAFFVRILMSRALGICLRHSLTLTPIEFSLASIKARLRLDCWTGSRGRDTEVAPTLSAYPLLRHLLQH